MNPCSRNGQVMIPLIDDWISEWPRDIIPAGAVLIVVEEDGTVVKGFYDPETEVIHIQEVLWRMK